MRARAELAVLDEQLVVVNEIADDTRLRALVAETPVASKEHDEASRHATVMLQTRRRWSNGSPSSSAARTSCSTDWWSVPVELDPAVRCAMLSIDGSRLDCVAPGLGRTRRP